jgi:hypothetical protein
MATCKILTVIGLFFLVSISFAQKPMVQDSKTTAPSGITVPSERKGKFDRLSGTVTLTKGLPSKEFSNLDGALGAFEENGYTEEGLKTLKSLLNNPYQVNEELPDAKPGPFDAVVVIEEDGPTTKFAISNKDLSGLGSLDAALARSETQSLCHTVGPCRVCGKKVYCLIRNLLSPAVNNANRR